MEVKPAGEEADALFYFQATPRYNATSCSNEQFVSVDLRYVDAEFRRLERPDRTNFEVRHTRRVAGGALIRCLQHRGLA